MRNRDLINRKLENIESKFEVLRGLLTNSRDVQDFITVIENSKDIIQELKNLVENEPISPDEIGGR